MKKLTILILLAFVGMAGISCNNKSKVAQTAPAPESAVQPGKPQYADSLLMSFERTPCFGTCPVFVVNVYKSGYATYFGKSNSIYPGLHYAYVDVASIKEIIKTADELGFFKLNDQYDGGVSDLPYHITVLRNKSVVKKITNKGGNGIPEGLIEVERMIEGQFRDVEWKPVAVK
ncbi:MAG: DUF6438 domain-containing protein [Bacteroidota bacterium]